MTPRAMHATPAKETRTIEHITTLLSANGQQRQYLKGKNVLLTQTEQPNKISQRWLPANTPCSAEHLKATNILLPQKYRIK